MSLAYQVYSQVASQLQVARAKVQEEKPVFAVVEPAVVPLNPSGTSKKIYILAFIFLSVCIVIFWKLFGENILNKFKESIFPAKTKQYYKRKYYLCTQVKLYTYRNENF